MSTSRFAIYPKEISRFIEYCERFQVIQNTEIKFTKEQEKVDDDGFIWKTLFVCDVSFNNELEALKFINVFSMIFTVSKYCSRI